MVRGESRGTLSPPGSLCRLGAREGVPAPTAWMGEARLAAMRTKGQPSRDMAESRPRSYGWSSGVAGSRPRGDREAEASLSHSLASSPAAVRERGIAGLSVGRARRASPLPGGDGARVMASAVGPDGQDVLGRGGMVPAERPNGRGKPRPYKQGREVRVEPRGQAPCAPSLQGAGERRDASLALGDRCLVGAMLASPERTDGAAPAGDRSSRNAAERKRHTPNGP